MVHGRVCGSVGMRWGQLLVAALLCLCVSSELDVPTQIHIALTGPSSVYISWSTRGIGNSQHIQYGVSRENLGTSRESSTEEYPRWSRRAHHVLLPNLRPSTEYFYRCGSGSEGWTEVLQFRSPPRPDSDAPVRMAAIACHGHTEHSVETRNAIERKGYDVLIQAGGLSYAGGEASKWDSYLDMMNPLTSKVPWMVAAGFKEKEYDTYDALRYRFRMPYGSSGSSSYLYYSFNYGIMHVVALSTEIDYHAGSTQYRWLLQDLKKAIKARHLRPWIVVYAHRPIYSSINQDGRPHPVDADLRGALEPLFVSYKVNAVLWGEVNAFERTHPVANAEPLPVGPVHVVLGVAGHGLNDRWHEPAPRWSAFHDGKEYGHVELHAFNATTLEVVFHSNRGHVVDTFTLRQKRFEEEKHKKPNIRPVDPDSVNAPASGWAITVFVVVCLGVVAFGVFIWRRHYKRHQYDYLK